MTVFFTTHYMEEAERVADRIAVIDHRRIVADGTAATDFAVPGGLAAILLAIGARLLSKIEV